MGQLKAYELQSSKQVSVLGELETTYGVDPKGGKLAMLLNTGATSKVQVETVTRDVLDKEFGSFGNAIVGKLWKKSYAQEGKGMGAEDGQLIEPEFSMLAQCCGQQKTVGYWFPLADANGVFERGDVVEAGDVIGVIENIDVGDTTWLLVRVTGAHIPANGDDISSGSGATAKIAGIPIAGLLYTPVSDETLHQSMTIYHYEGGANGSCKVGLGIRGSGKFTGTVKALPEMAWELSAIYQRPTDMPTAETQVSNVWPSPLVGVTAKVGTVDMTKVAFNSFGLDFGNDVQTLDDMEAPDAIGRIYIADANPTLTLKVSAPRQSTYPVYEHLDSGTLLDCAITYGTANGRRIRIGVNYAQLSGEIGESAEKQLKFYDLSFTANKFSGGARKHYIFVY